MILDVEMPMEESLTEEQQEIVESAAEMLYGLIHARWVNGFVQRSDSLLSQSCILTTLSLIQIHCNKSGDACHV